MRQLDVFRTGVERRGGRRIGVVVALVLVFALTVVVFTGCGDGNEATTSTEAGEATTSSVQASQAMDLQYVTPAGASTVDHISWNILGGEPPTLDPARVGTYGNSWVSSQIYDTLVRYSPEWELGPCIAESWKQVDPLTLVFTIRQDAKFWDGNPVTADDVVFSLKRQRDPGPARYTLERLGNVESIDKTGPWEVDRQVRRSGRAPSRSWPPPRRAVVQKAFVEAAGQAYGSGNNVMGSGTYKLASWTSGSEIELEANPDYWDPDLQAEGPDGHSPVPNGYEHDDERLALG